MSFLTKFSSLAAVEAVILTIINPANDKKKYQKDESVVILLKIDAIVFKRGCYFDNS